MTAPFFLPSSIASLAVAIPSPSRTEHGVPLGGGRHRTRTLARPDATDCPSLDRFLGALPGPDAHGLFDRADEDLSVTDATRLGALLDGVDDLLGLAVGNHDLD